MAIQKWLFTCAICAVQCLSTLSALNWTQPIDVSSSTQQLDQASVGLDANNNAFAAWVQGDGTDNLVSVSHYDAATDEWGTPVALSATNSSLPQLAVTQNGDALVVWQRNDSETSYQKIEYAAYHNGSWTTAAKIDTGHPDNENEFIPSVSVDETGKAFATWQAGGDPGNVIRAGTYDFATDTWSQIQDLSSTGTQSRERAMVTCTIAGTAIAVWEIRDTVNNEFRIESARYVSTAWQSVEVVTSSSTLQQLNPDIAIDPMGNACVIWTEWDPSTYNLTMNASRRTSSWSAPVVLSDTGYIVSGDLAKVAHVRLDNSGNAVALWVLVNASEGTGLVQSKLFQQGQWSTSTETLSTPCNISFNPQLTVNGSGDAVAIWITLLPSSVATTYASEYSITSNSWELPQAISDSSESAERPNIASNDQGAFFAIWFKTADESSGVLQAAKANNLYPVLPPATISGEQIVHYYVISTDRVNIINWGDSPSANISAYLVFRNNVMIAILTNTENSFEDHNRVENVADTYSIYAMNTSGTQSNPVTITLPN